MVAGPDLAARAYNAAAWHFAGSGRPRHDINFFDIQSLAEAEFLAPSVH
jgi:hypothetical protein